MESLYEITKKTVSEQDIERAATIYSKYISFDNIMEYLSIKKESIIPIKDGKRMYDIGDLNELINIIFLGMYYIKQLKELVVFNISDDDFNELYENVHLNGDKLNEFEKALNGQGTIYGAQFLIEKKRLYNSFNYNNCLADLMKNVIYTIFDTADQNTKGIIDSYLDCFFANPNLINVFEFEVENKINDSYLKPKINVLKEALKFYKFVFFDDKIINGEYNDYFSDDLMHFINAFNNRLQEVNMMRDDKDINQVFLTYFGQNIFDVINQENYKIEHNYFDENGLLEMHSNTVNPFIYNTNSSYEDYGINIGKLIKYGVRLLDRMRNSNDHFELDGLWKPFEIVGKNIVINHSNITTPLHLSIPISYILEFSNGIINRFEEDKDTFRDAKRKAEWFYDFISYKESRYVPNFPNKASINNFKESLKNQINMNKEIVINDLLTLQNGIKIDDFKKICINIIKILKKIGKNNNEIYDILINLPDEVFNKEPINKILDLVDKGLITNIDFLNISKFAFLYPNGLIKILNFLENYKNNEFNNFNNIFYFPEGAFKYPKNAAELFYIIKNENLKLDESDQIDFYKLPVGAFEYINNVIVLFYIIKEENQKLDASNQIDFYKLPNEAYVNTGIIRQMIDSINAYNKKLNSSVKINTYKLPKGAFKYPDKVISLFEIVQERNKKIENNNQIDFYRLSEGAFKNPNNFIYIFDIIQKENKKLGESDQIDFYKLPEGAFEHPDNVIKLFYKIKEKNEDLDEFDQIDFYRLPEGAFNCPDNIKESIDFINKTNENGNLFYNFFRFNNMDVPEKLLYIMPSWFFDNIYLIKNVCELNNSYQLKMEKSNITFFDFPNYALSINNDVKSYLNSHNYSNPKGIIENYFNLLYEIIIKNKQPYKLEINRLPSCIFKILYSKSENSESQKRESSFIDNILELQKNVSLYGQSYKIDFYKLDEFFFYNIDMAIDFLKRGINIKKLTFNIDNYDVESQKKYFCLLKKLIDKNEQVNDKLEINKLPYYIFKILYSESKNEESCFIDNIFKLKEKVSHYNNSLYGQSHKINFYSLDEFFFNNIDMAIDFLKRGINIQKLTSNDIHRLGDTNNIIVIYDSVKEYNSLIHNFDNYIYFNNLNNIVFSYVNSVTLLLKNKINISRLPKEAFMYPHNTIKLFNHGIDIYKLPAIAFKTPSITLELYNIINIYNAQNKSNIIDFYNLSSEYFYYYDIPIQFQELIKKYNRDVLKEQIHIKEIDGKYIVSSNSSDLIKYINNYNGSLIYECIRLNNQYIINENSKSIRYIGKVIDSDNSFNNHCHVYLLSSLPNDLKNHFYKHNEKLKKNFINMSDLEDGSISVTELWGLIIAYNRGRNNNDQIPMTHYLKDKKTINFIEKTKKLIKSGIRIDLLPDYLVKDLNEINIDNLKLILKFYHNDYKCLSFFENYMFLFKIRNLNLELELKKFNIDYYKKLYHDDDFFIKTFALGVYGKSVLKRWDAIKERLDCMILHKKNDNFYTFILIILNNFITRLRNAFAHYRLNIQNGTSHIDMWDQDNSGNIMFCIERCNMVDMVELLHSIENAFDDIENNGKVAEENAIDIYKKFMDIILKSEINNSNKYNRLKIPDEEEFELRIFIEHCKKFNSYWKRRNYNEKNAICSLIWYYKSCMNKYYKNIATSTTSSLKP